MAKLISYYTFPWTLLWLTLCYQFQLHGAMLVIRSFNGDDFSSSDCSRYNARFIGKGQCKCANSLNQNGTLLSNQNGELNCFYNATIATGCGLRFLNSGDVKFVETVKDPDSVNRIKDSLFTRNMKTPISDCTTFSKIKVETWIDGKWQIFDSNKFAIFDGIYYSLGFSITPVESTYEGHLMKIVTECTATNNAEVIQECLLIKFKGERTHQIVEPTPILKTILKTTTTMTTSSIPTFTKMKPTKTIMTTFSTITSVVVNSTIMPVTSEPTSNEVEVIVGSVIGSVVFLLILVILLACYYRRKKRQDKTVIEERPEIGNSEKKDFNLEHKRSEPNAYSVPDVPIVQEKVYLSPIELQGASSYEVIKAKVKNSNSSSIKKAKPLSVARKLKMSIIRKSTKTVKDNRESRLDSLHAEMQNQCRKFSTVSSTLNKSDFINQNKTESPEKKESVIPAVRVMPRIPSPYKKRVESITEQAEDATKVTTEVDPAKDTPLKGSLETSVNHKHRKPKKTPSSKNKAVDETSELKTVPEIPTINVEKVNNDAANESFYDIPNDSVWHPKMNLQVEESFYETPDSGSIKVAKEKGSKRKRYKLKLKSKSKKKKESSEPVYDGSSGTIGRNTAIPNLAYDGNVSDDGSSWGDDFDKDDGSDDDAVVDTNQNIHVKPIGEDKSEQDIYDRSKSESLPHNSSYETLEEYRRNSYEPLRNYTVS